MMMYDLLKNYKNYLLQSYSQETANTYYKRLCILFEGQSLTNTASNLDFEKILDSLKQIKYKNYFSQSKNALLHFCKFQGVFLCSDILKSIKEIENGTRKKYRKFALVDFKEVDSAIKHIKNKKLKISYQTIIATGLRVSEVAQIRPRDCIVTSNTITFGFVGKGGANETVMMIKSENPTLFQSITEHMKSTGADKKLFYSAVYLQRQAKNLGFACHDLRRAYAKLEYKKCGSKDEVKEKMRHSNAKNTSIYLESKVKL